MVPLANLIVKETLSEEDVLTCQKTVYNLVDMERKNDPLPISTVGSRGKGPKRYLFKKKLTSSMFCSPAEMSINITISESNQSH